MVLRDIPKLMDEATSALDLITQKAIMELLMEIQRTTHMSYLLIMYDFNLVHHYCTRVVVMHEGMVVESGNTEDILNHPIDPYTKALIKAMV